MGEELCRNEEWLDASASYAKSAFHAVEVLRRFPPVLRSWVAPFIPEVKATRAVMAHCREILAPVVAERQAAKAAAIVRGERPPAYDDSMEWFEKEFGSGCDAAKEQYVSPAPRPPPQRKRRKKGIPIPFWTGTSRTI